jgi:hypothetical protein
MVESSYLVLVRSQPVGRSDESGYLSGIARFVVWLSRPVGLGHDTCPGKVSFGLQQGGGLGGAACPDGRLGEVATVVHHPPVTDVEVG